MKELDVNENAENECCAKTKQYCRYCAHCVATLDDFAWCEKRQKEMSESSAKRTNRCGDFLFNEMDAFNPEAKYKPRAKKEKFVDNSPLLFEVQKE